MYDHYKRGMNVITLVIKQKNLVDIPISLYSHKRVILSIVLPYVVSNKVYSGGSRISRWVGGAANFRCRHFSVKTYAKTKELDPVGSANGLCFLIFYIFIFSFSCRGEIR